MTDEREDPITPEGPMAASPDATAPTPDATAPTPDATAPTPDATEPTVPAAESGTDLARRRFFRQFAGEVFQAAATVVGAATVLQRQSAEAAASILNPDFARDEEATEPADLHDAAPRGFRTPFRFADDDRTLLLVDQRRLPDALVEHPVRSAAEAAWAIRHMVVRGAPAMGQVAALSLALTAGLARNSRPYARRATLRGAARALIDARPTAVNVRWAVERVLARYEALGGIDADGDEAADAMRAEAEAIVGEATDDHGRLAEAGLAALPVVEGRPLQLLTHCNTGPLACGQFGTALGVVQAAHTAGREVHVWVDETRPYLQGARLTAWELQQAGVAHTLLPDAAAGYLLARGEVDAILVGADRIAANGDTANKVGTYPLAVLAARHGVPFFVCAPLSSVDLGTPDGAGIPIEERPADEVLLVRGQRIAPDGTAVRNPAFDVTPAELITAIVTEEGLLRPPFAAPLVNAVARRDARRGAPSVPARTEPGAA